VAGVNLPMLIRALCYREKLSLDQLIQKALSGGTEGVMPMPAPAADTGNT
jgi:mannose PTS system EIIA component